MGFDGPLAETERADRTRRRGENAVEIGHNCVMLWEDEEDQ